MADSYVYREYPKWLYHRHSIPGPVLPSDHRFSRIVDSPAEQAALGQDWTNDLAALQLEDAPAVPSDDVSSGAHEWNVAGDALDFLQFLLREIRTWLSESVRFSAFYDSTGPELIGGPEHDEQRRRQQQRLAELIEQTTRVFTQVPPEGNAVVAGLDALKTFALDHRFACAHRLLKLPGQPVRVDRIGEVLEAWCRHLMTKALSGSRKPDASRLLTVKKAAELLNCHEDTVRDMGRRGEIEIIKIGRRGQRIKGSEILRLRNTPKFSDR